MAETSPLLDSVSIKKALLSEGIDLVGIAPAQGILLASPARPPERLMPTAKSVIVMAVAHSLGAVHSPDIKLWTRNKMQASRLLDSVGEKLGRLLESAGFLSLPISADKPAEIHKLDPETGRRLGHVKTLGQLSLKHAAVSAGLGAIGRSNLLLTGEFGPHQRLGAVITAARLEPDSPKAADPCPPKCRLCIEACPVGALKQDRYDVDPCFTYWSLGFEKMAPRNPLKWPAYALMLLSHARRRDVFNEYSQTMITDVDYCIECMKACPLGDRWKGMRPANAWK